MSRDERGREPDNARRPPKSVRTAMQGTPRQPATQCAPAPFGMILARLHARGLTYEQIAEAFGVPVAKVLGLVWFTRCLRGGGS